jgi:hypothetical protein
MTTEPELKVCAYCEHEKVRVWSGAKLKDGSKVYIDHKHQRWAGRRCPDCEKSRVQTAVKCDRFAKGNILRELEGKGFEIVSSAVPIKVRKDGIEFTVGMRRAYMDNGNIMIENDLEPGVDMVALVFETVRIATPEQIAVMPNVKVAGRDQSTGQLPDDRMVSRPAETGGSPA